MITLFDPLLRGPVLGSMLISVACSLLGVFSFVRREGLVGEVLAHATYPGVVLAALVTGLFGFGDLFFTCALFGSALLCGWLALGAASRLIRIAKLSSDNALCFVLASFFAVGMLGSSLCQNLFPFWQRQITPYLFGQIAVMDDTHLLLGVFAVFFAALFASLYYKEMGAHAFDPSFCRSSGLCTKYSQRFFRFALALGVVLAIKSMGVILMSGLLIAPAICARQCTKRLGPMLLIAPVFGLLGTMGGLAASLYIEALKPIAPGPLIVLALSSLCLIVHLFAPREGFFVRAYRRQLFHWKCLEENILKKLWRLDEGIDRISLQQLHLGPYFLVSWSLYQLRRRGLITCSGRWVNLSDKGQRAAQRIVRLHRLWEAYLASCLDVSAARVHASAEQIEHILTPDLIEQLERLVDADFDPHASIIPEEASL